MLHVSLMLHLNCLLFTQDDVTCVSGAAPAEWLNCLLFPQDHVPCVSGAAPTEWISYLSLIILQIMLIIWSATVTATISQGSGVKTVAIAATKHSWKETRDVRGALSTGRTEKVNWLNNERTAVLSKVNSLSLNSMVLCDTSSTLQEEHSILTGL